MSTDSPKAPLPKFKLLVMCAECDRGIEVPLPTDRTLFALTLVRQGWFMSVLTVLTPPNQDPAATITVGAICESCAPRVWSPEFMLAAEEWRRKLLANTPGPATT
jgi:hypothetical protein